MPGMPKRFVTGCCVLTTGVLLLLAAGCGSAPQDDFQTISPEEAEQIEQARRDRAQKAEADETRPDAAEPDETPLSPVNTSGSPLVLAAAQTAAAAARPSQQRDADSEAASASAADPWAETQITETQQQTAAQSPATPPAEAGKGADSPVELAASRAAGAVQAEPVERTIQLLVPERSFSVEGPDDAIRISYDDFDLLKVLNMEPVPVDAVDHFPEWLKDLDGKRVRVRGFMYPTFQETDIPGFVLARDNQICCFGRNPKIYDLVEVTLAPGVTTDYIQGRPFDVVGQFHIRPEADGDELWQLYQMTDAIVIDK